MSDAQQQSPDAVSFDEASRVTGAERHYSATVHPSWDGPLTTHGGLLAALALNAIDAEINRDNVLQPRSLTCHYLRPPQHGEVEIFVDPLRRGRRFASSRATISQGGKPCIAALATHSARDLPEVAAWALSPPDVPGPPAREDKPMPSEEIADGGEAWLEMPEGIAPFFHRFLLAPRFGHGPFMGPPVDPAVGTSNGGWITTREPRPIDTSWLLFMVDALWPSIFQPIRTPIIAPTLDLTTHIRASIPPEGLPDQPLLVHNYTRAIAGGLSDSDSFVYAADGTLLAQARQLQLVAPLEV
ncbi:MAG: thioesterase family protein [Thermoleophilaceae bacterium]|nr:thioesterase family protein [Thermoleophilaceae bacterium]